MRRYSASYPQSLNLVRSSCCSWPSSGTSCSNCNRSATYLTSCRQLSGTSSVDRGRSARAFSARSGHGDGAQLALRVDGLSVTATVPGELVGDADAFAAGSTSG